MAAVALERAVLTHEILTIQLVRAVGAVDVVVAAVASGHALAVAAAELGSRTVAVLVVAQFVAFVVAVGAVALEIARPSARDAALVLALEFRRFVALGAVLRQFIRS